MKRSADAGVVYRRPPPVSESSDKQLFRGEGGRLVKTILTMSCGVPGLRVLIWSYAVLCLFGNRPPLQVARIVGGCLYQVNTNKVVVNNLYVYSIALQCNKFE